MTLRFEPARLGGFYPCHEAVTRLGLVSAGALAVLGGGAHDEPALFSTCPHLSQGGGRRGAPSSCA
jgi:hypothetical protein